MRQTKILLTEIPKAQASHSTVQKAKDLSELVKLNGTVSSAEKQISELYGKIGFEVYCAYCKAPLPEVSSVLADENHMSLEGTKP